MSILKMTKFPNMTIETIDKNYQKKPKRCLSCMHPLKKGEEVVNIYSTHTSRCDMMHKKCFALELVALLPDYISMVKEAVDMRPRYERLEE